MENDTQNTTNKTSSKLLKDEPNSSITTEKNAVKSDNNNNNSSHEARKQSLRLKKYESPMKFSFFIMVVVGLIFVLLAYIIPFGNPLDSKNINDSNTISDDSQWVASQESISSKESIDQPHTLTDRGDENQRQSTGSNENTSSEEINSEKDIIETLKEEYLKNLEEGSRVTVSDLSYLPSPEYPHVRNRTQIGVENATFYILVRNSELFETLQTMREIEDRFNRKYRYPWTFLNDVPFTEEFKRLTTGMASGKTEYGLVPKEFWSIPDFIDEDKFHEALEDYENRKVIYGGSQSYRHMCRFNSGFFFRHELMLQYEWYWRVEPGTRFYCDQLYDPFTFMRENNKIYGFVIAIPEYQDTIPTLWDTCEEFFNNNSDVIAKDNAEQFILDKNAVRPGDVAIPSSSRYNMCHFWSNFEIGNLNFFRSDRYLRFFNHLDKKGGFFYERWGDAPVHTIALSVMVNRSEIHHFSDIGYRHLPYYRCPHDQDSYNNGRCLCDQNPAENIDFHPISCLPKWWIHGGRHFLYQYKDQLILM